MIHDSKVKYSQLDSKRKLMNCRKRRMNCRRVHEKMKKERVISHQQVDSND